MLFKDLKQNYPVFILDKQNVKFTQGKVQSVSFPHIDNSSPMGMGKTVVDVVIEAEGKSATYAIPENNSVVYAGDMVLSTEKDGILKEVEAMKTSAEQILSSVEKQKEIIEQYKCDCLNPHSKRRLLVHDMQIKRYIKTIKPRRFNFIHSGKSLTLYEVNL